MVVPKDLVLRIGKWGELVGKTPGSGIKKAFSYTTRINHESISFIAHFNIHI